MPQVFAGQRSDSDPLNVLIDYQTYTPTLISTGTQPNIGSTGTLYGVWWRSGRKIAVWVYLQFNGTGVNGGSGSIAISLPFPIDQTLHNFGGLLDSSVYGVATIHAVSVPIVLGATAIVGNVSIFNDTNFGLRQHGSASAASTSGFVAGDYVSVYIEYFPDEASLPATPENQDVYSDAAPMPSRVTQYIDDYKPYSPVLLDINGDPMNIGEAGEVTGFWRRSGRLIDGNVQLEIGSTPSLSGIFFITLPVAADQGLMVPATATGNLRATIGSGHARDNSTAANSMGLLTQLALTAGDQTMVFLPVSGTTFIASGSPFTWTTADRLSTSFAYIGDVLALDE